MMCWSLRRFGIVATTAALVACGGKAVVDGSPGEGGAGGTGGTDTGTHTGTHTGTTTGTTTGTVTGTQTGTSPSCYQTHDGFGVALSTYDGESRGCNAGSGSTGSFTLQGEIVAIGDGYLQIDSCPPNADCMPMLSDLWYAAPGSYQNLWEGTFVELRLWVDQPWACVETLEIWNLPEWGGVDNPYWPSQTLWFMGADGTLTPASSPPFTVSKLPLNCYPNGPSCGVPQDDFVLRFAQASEPSNAFDVAQGQLLDVYLGPDIFLVRNLRSYESGMCDDNWNYAFWAEYELMYD